MAKAKYIKLSNGTGAKADLVAGVSYGREDHRVFLKSATGNSLCSVDHDSHEEAQEEIASVNQKMGT